MQKQTITVEGMTCHHCEMTVENAVRSIKNVKKVKASHPDKKVDIEYENFPDPEAIKMAIRAAGYQTV